jgi:squalene-hopene/tetraprenyl-beta-curcumene cyclase
MLSELVERLMAARNEAGHWEGELSSSALSTATAVFAIKLYLHERARAGSAHFADSAPRSVSLQPEETVRSADPAGAELESLVGRGVAWLIQTQNGDGGWGDTTRSLSNISTTALCWAALADSGEDHPAAVKRVEAWLTRAAGSLDPKTLARAIGDRYGKDRTFSVPILTMCALAGRLGDDRAAWRFIPQLPFELAACPYRWFQIIRLPVVSYALPALIAMGQVRHARRPTRNPVTRFIRWLAHNRTLRVLQSIQPRGGGFLEATPLTSFVAMSLIGAGQVDHPVVGEGIAFLVRSVRADGSWPIDTNLSTWVTTLSINALREHSSLGERDRAILRDWILGQQYKVEHPYTHAAPGGWAWTDLPGGVPDADDTAGALLALWHLDGDRGIPARSLEAAIDGVRWLLDLQNRDGGIPTFCRGWGALPFDRSGADLTAHAIHAWAVWRSALPPALAGRVDKGTGAAMAYLETHQQPDGSWLPLWFGNEACADECNRTYGTARVLAGLAAHDFGEGVAGRDFSGSKEMVRGADSTGIAEGHLRMIERGVRWLTEAQNADGSWGGGRGTAGSVEETALAIQALRACEKKIGHSLSSHIEAGVAYLHRACESVEFLPTPIGFYFAKLWYFEKLYPLIYAVGAMNQSAP